jgi:hypothetical protein
MLGSARALACWRWRPAVATFLFAILHPKSSILLFALVGRDSVEPWVLAHRRLRAASASDAIASMRRFLFAILLSSILFLFPQAAPCTQPQATLADLKKLEILCYIPSHLPKDFKLKSVTITYDEPGPDENSAGRFPLYNLEYGDNRGGSFTIESAREGIGDRNLMETEDSEECTIKSPFGPMYLIYTPKGQGKSGRKHEIKANWAEDPNMKRERAEHPQGHPILGRYHGFSTTGLSLSEFEKVIQSLKPLRP